jgi:hypothetical protein
MNALGGNRKSYRPKISVRTHGLDLTAVLLVGLTDWFFHRLGQSFHTVQFRIDFPSPVRIFCFPPTTKERLLL